MSLQDGVAHVKACPQVAREHIELQRTNLKRMTPSGLNDFQGCRLISTMRSVVSDRSLKEGCFFARSWYAF